MGETNSEQTHTFCKSWSNSSVKRETKGVEWLLPCTVAEFERSGEKF